MRPYCVKIYTFYSNWVKCVRWISTLELWLCTHTNRHFLKSYFSSSAMVSHNGYCRQSLHRNSNPNYKKCYLFVKFNAVLGHIVYSNSFYLVPIQLMHLKYISHRVVLVVIIRVKLIQLFSWCPFYLLKSINQCWWSRKWDVGLFTIKCIG